jgi:hypothetical protein
MIDTLSLMAYLPTKLTKGLQNFLAGVSKISDPIDIPPDLILKRDITHMYNGYRGKIEFDKKPVLILES